MMRASSKMKLAKSWEETTHFSMMVIMWNNCSVIYSISSITNQSLRWDDSKTVDKLKHKSNIQPFTCASTRLFFVSSLDKEVHFNVQAIMYQTKVVMTMLMYTPYIKSLSLSLSLSLSISFKSNACETEWRPAFVYSWCPICTINIFIFVACVFFGIKCAKLVCVLCVQFIVWQSNLMGFYKCVFGMTCLLCCALLCCP